MPAIYLRELQSWVHLIREYKHQMLFFVVETKLLELCKYKATSICFFPHKDQDYIRQATDIVNSNKIIKNSSYVVGGMGTIKNSSDTFEKRRSKFPNKIFHLNNWSSASTNLNHQSYCKQLHHIDDIRQSVALLQELYLLYG